MTRPEAWDWRPTSLTAALRVRCSSRLWRALSTRGVAVRVLIDGVGALYSHPPIVRDLQARRVPVARFLPVAPSRSRIPYFNLRNHRKLLIVDGRVGFCGGVNIRDACLLARHAPDATQDIHFRIRGPVVGHLLSAFQFDWAVCDPRASHRAGPGRLLPTPRVRSSPAVSLTGQTRISRRCS